jgi:hypothetical protein
MPYEPIDDSPRSLRSTWYACWNEFLRIAGFVNDLEAELASLQVLTEFAIDAASDLDQNPTGLGDAGKIQITFGPAQTTIDFDLDAAGQFTTLVTDEYYFQGKFEMGRDGQAGQSQLYLRALVNGSQVGYSTHLIVDSPRVEAPVSFTGYAVLQVGDLITFELMRDSDGGDSGGLTVGISQEPSWTFSPSARALITRNVLVRLVTP